MTGNSFDSNKKKKEVVGYENYLYGILQVLEISDHTNQEWRGTGLD